MFGIVVWTMRKRCALTTDEKFHPAAQRIFLKDLRIRLLSEFFALCEKETLVSEFGYSCLFVY